MTSGGDQLVTTAGAAGDGPAPDWRDRALALALEGGTDARALQQAISGLLDSGEPCAPEQVVAALWAGRGRAERAGGRGDGGRGGAERAGGRGDGGRGRAERAGKWRSGGMRRGLARLRALDARFVLAGDDAYPVPLRAAWPELGAPLWLFATGLALRLDGAPAVAVVGTRAPTLDGLHTARALGAALARAGAVVVSGLARGIDQAAHRGALDAGGRTVAVLGTGLGVDYPARSATLRGEIARQGMLVTELAPGTGPRPWTFLARNRIVSGLAAATVVVEGGPASGALHTARMAAAQGRDVWAVPGSINAPMSQAPLLLLRDGATPLTSIDDLLDSLALSSSGRGEEAGDGGDGDRGGTLSVPARRVLGLLSAVPASTDALVAAGSLPAHVTMAAVAELVEAGVAAETPRGVVRC